jgi:hypothetical protein
MPNDPKNKSTIDLLAEAKEYKRYGRELQRKVERDPQNIDIPLSDMTIDERNLNDLIDTYNAAEAAKSELRRRGIDS